MFDRTPDTFIPGQEIYLLDCSFGDHKPELRKLYVVGSFLYRDQLMVEATAMRTNIDYLATLGGYHDIGVISKNPRRIHGEYPSSSRYCFSVSNPFFLTEGEVAILADIGKNNTRIGKLLDLMGIEEGDGRTIPKEDLLLAVDWVLYWRVLHPRTQT